MEFEYDPAKSRSNKEKHGMDFEEAKELWTGNFVQTPLRVVAGETRVRVIGKVNGVFWSAIITMRGKAVRIISARRARDEEKEKYQDYFR